MNSKKILIIIITCVTIGIVIVGCCVIVEWHITSEKEFTQWIISSDGLKYMLTFAEDFGISLISAAVFLVGVEFIVEKTKSKESEEKKIAFLHDTISKEMREDTQKCLQKIKSFEKKDALLKDQFFAECDFSNTILDGENFSNTNFSEAKFICASLVGTNFTKCILEGVDFKDAKLSFAIFTGASLDTSILKYAHSLWKATMPDGSRYDGRFNLEGDFEMAIKMGYDLSNQKHLKEFYEQNNVSDQ